MSLRHLYRDLNHHGVYPDIIHGHLPLSGSIPSIRVSKYGHEHGNVDNKFYSMTTWISTRGYMYRCGRNYHQELMLILFKTDFTEVVHHGETYQVHRKGNELRLRHDNKDTYLCDINGMMEHIIISEHLLKNQWKIRDVNDMSNIITD